MRKVVLIISIILLVSSLIVGANEAGIKVKLDDKIVEFTEESGMPFLDANNRIQVPFRATLESLGITVDWDNDKRIAMAEKDGIKIDVPIGENYILKNKQKLINDTVALIKDGRTYLPIRIVMEGFGAKVTWEPASKTVLITSPQVVSSEVDMINKLFDTIAGSKEILFDTFYYFDNPSYASSKYVGSEAIKVQYFASKDFTTIYISKYNNETLSALEEITKIYFPNSYEKVYEDFILMSKKKSGSMLGKKIADNREYVTSKSAENIVTLVIYPSGKN